jgi:hypothetical protein
MRGPCPRDWHTLRADGFRHRRSLVRPRLHSKAVGHGSNRRLCLIPLRTVQGRHRAGRRNRAGRRAAAFHLRPTLPLKEEEDASIRPTKHTHPTWALTAI